jgi:hypothetical protein
MKLGSVALLLPLMSQAANYSVKTALVDGIEVVQLADAARKTEVTVVPTIGNIAYRMMVNGKNALWVPYEKLSEMKSKPAMGGVPFLAPWANRLDQQAFWANGKKYAFDMDLGNVRGATPIHGLLSNSHYWQVISVAADKQYHGDLEGTGLGQMLAGMAAEVKDSGAYVAIERVRGTLQGRTGSFAVHHRGVMTRGAQDLAITIVPDSGTGGLAGITGTMTIDIRDGKHFYGIDYLLP